MNTLYTPATYTKLLANCTVEAAPRGLATYEHPVPIMFVARAGEFVARAGFSRRLALIEFLHILAGKQPSEDAIRWAAPRADPDLFKGPIGAYGPRLFERHQLERVVATLEADRSSRQAVALIIRHTDAGNVQPPCTVGIQFLARGKYVHGYVWMRSWDLIKGLPYDTAIFGGLVQVVASHLEARPGNLFVFATSPHYYAGDAALVKDVQVRRFDFTWLGTLRETQRWARAELRRRQQWNPLPYGVQEVIVND